jgi:benzoate-CoA ligase
METKMTEPTVVLPERFNFAAHLLELNAARSGKTAYIDDNGTLSYGELDERVRRMAAALLASGIRPEERVLLVMQDTIDMPVAFLGALFAGIIAVPVNTLLPADDYAYMIEHSGAKAVIVSSALLSNVQEALTKTAARPML